LVGTRRVFADRGGDGNREVSGYVSLGTG